MPVVWVWLALSIVGSFVSAFLTREFIKVFRALSEDGGVRRERTVAFSRFLREGGRLTVHIFYIVAGLAALDVIDAPWVIIPTLVYGNVVLLMNSVIDARTRRLLFATRGSEAEISH